ncbi:amino acid permease [Candidatus Dependentiae bacterium]|nr:amino acid permease [Candidatus Dependentiae bacterium]
MSTSTPQKTSTSTKIGVATATIVGMNAMIGSGIFTAPAALAADVGPAGILAYFFVIPAVWFMALSIARLAQLFPEEGSFYIYTKQWAGHTFGMITVTAYFIGLLIAMGLLAQVAGIYLQVFFPSMSAYVLGIIVLWALVLLNMFGVALSKTGQHILIACTVFPLIATTIICLLNAKLSLLTPFAPHGYLSVLKATRIVIFGFFGFECAASLFNIVKDPQKNVPKALTYSIGIVGIIYTLFVFSLITCIPTHLFGGALTALSKTLGTVFPNHPWLITFIGISMLSAVAGTIHSMIWSSSHLLTLIVKKVKSKSIAQVLKPALKQKWAALVVGLGIFAACLGLKGAYVFFDLTAIFLVFAYTMSMITLLTIKEEWKSGQNVKTILGIITATIIVIFAVEGLIAEITKLF